MLDVVKDQAGALHEKVGWNSGIRNESSTIGGKQMGIIFMDSLVNSQGMVVVQSDITVVEESWDMVMYTHSWL